MPDLGKHVPWPAPPRSLTRPAEYIHNIFLRWRAFKILSKYPRDEWPQMWLKLTTMEVLQGKRRDWGLNRRWRGDYLNDASENGVDAAVYRSALTKESVAASSVLFSALTVKFNRKNKANERAIVFTRDNKILKMNPAKKYKTMETFNLLDVTAISISPDAGCALVLIHLRGAFFKWCDGEETVLSIKGLILILAYWESVCFKIG